MMMIIIKGWNFLQYSLDHTNTKLCGDVNIFLLLFLSFVLLFTRLFHLHLPCLSKSFDLLCIYQLQYNIVLVQIIRTVVGCGLELYLYETQKARRRDPMLARRSPLSNATVAVSVLSDMAYTRVYYLSDVFAMVWFVKRLINDKRCIVLLGWDDLGTNYVRSRNRAAIVREIRLWLYCTVRC